MKKATIRKLIQKPLRFHHQDIHDEIEALTNLVIVMNNRLIAMERHMRSFGIPSEEKLE